MHNLINTINDSRSSEVYLYVSIKGGTPRVEKREHGKMERNSKSFCGCEYDRLGSRSWNDA